MRTYSRWWIGILLVGVAMGQEPAPNTWVRVADTVSVRGKGNYEMVYAPSVKRVVPGSPVPSSHEGLRPRFHGNATVSSLAYPNAARTMR